MKEFFVFCAMCSLAGPFLAIETPIIQNVTFLSTNFENIFTWEIEEGSPPGTVYQVRYKRYEDAYWHSKAECQNITQLFCNLTRETEDATEWYYAKVRAIVPNCCVSNWVQSLRFCPFIDTTIEKPSVKYTPGIRSITFSIQPPDTPLRDKENRTLTVIDVFNKLNIDVQYEITLFFQNMEQKWANIKNDNEFEITKLDPGTEYNGTVHLKYFGKNSNPQAFQVQTLSGHFLAIKPPNIQQATFLSINFENILTWKTEEESPPGTVYQVQYKMSMDPYWHSKAECQNITQQFCNLTCETEDVIKHYHARVRAIIPNGCVSNWVRSLSFYPFLHTTIGEPSVKHIPRINSIHFLIQPPYTPLRDKENRTLTVVDALNKVGVDVQYEITLISQETEQKWANIENNKEFEITKLDSGMKYNGTVHLKYFGKNSIPQAFQVQTLAADPIIQKYPHFLFTNFENILTWKIEEESPPGTVYQVQYKRYRDAYWHSKAECQNITQLSCNLTHEMEDVTAWYYARVRAIVPNCCVSNWVPSLRFFPMDHTTIGKPSVDDIPGLQSIKFSIQPPYTPFRDKENRILTVIDVFNKFDICVQYEITIFPQKPQQKWANIENDKEFEITKLDPGTKYNGTVHLKYFGKNSTPLAFQVQTLAADTSWLFYVLGTILFILIFLFGTIYYLIYKYIKPHTDQKPASLNFKDVSHFQPFVLDVELSPSSLSKTTPHVLEVRPAELCQPILNMLKHQESFSPTEVAYQQQTKTSPIQPPVQHFSQTDAPSTGYTPQVIKNSPLCPLEHNPSTLTNELCMEEASSINKANHVIKLDSFISSGPYKGQRPEWANEELQESETHQKPEEEVESVSQTQPLRFPEDSIGLPQEFPCLLPP